MVLESTIICVDSSEYMRNGDYFPTRLSAEIDAVNLVCYRKTRSNPENNVGLVTMNNGRVMVTLTSEAYKIGANLSKLQPSGKLNFETGIRVAHLALKHRQGRNHKMRIVAFIGSPIEEDQNELIKIAKRLKKEKVSVDLVCFGQEGENEVKLEVFIQTLNGKDGAGGSHLLSIPPGAQLTDALAQSVILQGEGGSEGVAGQETDQFGMDTHEDPELAMALRVSMEEERARGAGQEGTAANSTSGQPDNTAANGNVPVNVARETAVPAGTANFAAMTEDEQLAHAMRLSMSEQPPPPTQGKDEPMDTDEPSK